MEIDKLVTDVTHCIQFTINSTTFTTPTNKNGEDVVCKLVEVKNRSGVDILVIPNDTDSFPMENKEDRVIVVKKLSDLKIARSAGSGSVIVHLLLEN